MPRAETALKSVIALKSGPLLYSKFPDICKAQRVHHGDLPPRCEIGTSLHDDLSTRCCRTKRVDLSFEHLYIETIAGIVYVVFIYQKTTIT